MAAFTFTPLVPKSPENVNSLNTIITQIQASLNSVDETQLSNGLLQKLGLNNGSQIGRGFTSITATEARSNVAYGTLTTPDQVASVVVPANALIAIVYQAVWFEAVALAARAAIFIGATQLKAVLAPGTAPQVQETNTQSVGAVGNAIALGSGPGGLRSQPVNATPYPGDVTTGQVVGPGTGAEAAYFGPTYAFAAAGTYTISVQYKASSGAVSAQARKLWVWTIGF